MRRTRKRDPQDWTTTMKIYETGIYEMGKVDPVAYTTSEGTVVYFPSDADRNSVSDEEFETYRARLVKEIKAQDRARGSR